MSGMASPQQEGLQPRREVELRCDAFAVLTLLQLDLDHALVVSVAQKLTRFNEPIGIRTDAEQYPGVDLLFEAL